VEDYNYKGFVVAVASSPLVILDVFPGLLNWVVVLVVVLSGIATVGKSVRMYMIVV
jgi:Flp pilus assembly protein TadG